jgi:RimJ/RimL family protein N-acetyltransferase
VSAGSRSACWGLEDAGVLGRVLQFAWDEEGHAFISVVVDPAKRGRGLGTRLLSSFLARHSEDFESLTASVAPDNRASLALALRFGFEQIRVDDEGFVQLQLRRIPS